MGAIKDITDLTIKLLESKDARKVSTEILKIQSLVATLQSEQAALSERNAELQHENLQLRKELDQAVTTHRARKPNLRSQLSLQDNVYLPASDGVPGYGTGPWCTNCFDTSEALITLHHKAAGGINDVVWYKWECPNCKSSVAAPRR